MGRTEKSQGLAPPAIRKDIRAKLARHIVNKVVPSLLASNARARKGSEGSELIANPEPITASDDPASRGGQHSGGENTTYIKRKGQGRRKVKAGPELDIAITASGKSQQHKKRNASPSEPQGQDIQAKAQPPRKIRIIVCDTLTAARSLVPKGRNHSNPCVLNMASPLRPGGGVLAGATSQEEFLCARTTLLPSLKESFYRLPELGGIFTRDVMVFRDAGGLGDATGELPATERWFVDVVSAGMLRFPDVDGGEEEEKRLAKKDREMVEKKMRAVLRIASAKGARKVVLGAWGCGAYGNPLRDIAEAWSAVLLPKTEVKKNGKSKQAAEKWEGLQEVVFAIANAKMARDFAVAFDGDIEVEEASGWGEEDNEEDEEDAVAIELRGKIAEIESQVGQVVHATLKQRLEVILEGLKAQLREREGILEEDDHEYSDEDDGDADKDAEANDEDSEKEEPISDADDGLGGSKNALRDESDVDSDSSGGLELELELELQKNMKQLRV